MTGVWHMIQFLGILLQKNSKYQCSESLISSSFIDDTSKSAKNYSTIHIISNS